MQQEIQSKKVNWGIAIGAFFVWIFAAMLGGFLFPLLIDLLLGSELFGGIFMSMAFPIVIILIICYCLIFLGKKYSDETRKKVLMWSVFALIILIIIFAVIMFLAGVAFHNSPIIM